MPRPGPAKPVVAMRVNPKDYALFKELRADLEAQGKTSPAEIFHAIVTSASAVLGKGQPSVALSNSSRPSKPDKAA